MDGHLEDALKRSHRYGFQIQQANTSFLHGEFLKMAALEFHHDNELFRAADRDETPARQKCRCECKSGLLQSRSATREGKTPGRAWSRRGAPGNIDQHRAIRSRMFRGRPL